jgi:hypothetical protein
VSIDPLIRAVEPVACERTAGGLTDEPRGRGWPSGRGGDRLTGEGFAEVLRRAEAADLERATARAATTRTLVVAVCCFVVLFALSITAGPASAALPEFGTEGEGAGQFAEPNGIAIDHESGDVVLADTQNNRVEEFTSSGAFVRTWGWGVRDGKAEFEICEAPSSCQAGLRGSGAGEFEQASGVAIDDSAGVTQGDIYVVDRQNDRVDRFGPKGEFILSFGQAGPGPGQFEGLENNDIAVGSTGTV